MQTKRASFPFLRTVSARMIERYIFNFRMRPDELAKKLPVPWLEPQVVNGWCAVSFCILWLDRLTVAPIPPVIPFQTLSSAYRIGVIDTSQSEPEASVYITNRWADNKLIAALAPLVLLDTIPAIDAAHGHTPDDVVHVQMSQRDGRHIFSAQARSSETFESEVFDSLDDFVGFIKGGVSSYAPSTKPGALSKVNLHKEDVQYAPLAATIEFSALHHEWSDTTMEFDSAVRATGSKYVWTYKGLFGS